MIKDMEAVSLFQYQEGCHLKKLEKCKSDEIALRATGEAVILQILYKYGPLNKALIEKFMLFRKKNFSIDRSLYLMRNQGKLDHYVLEGSSQALDIYEISDRQLKKMENGKKRKGKRHIIQLGTIETLRHLSVMQWHAAMMIHDLGSTELAAEKIVFTKIGITVIPSMIRISSGLCVCAIPAPKEDGRYGEFALQLLTVQKYLCQQYKQGKIQVVILCESMAHIREVHHMLKIINETRGYLYLYTIDRITHEENPLSMLYHVEEGKNETVFSLCKISEVY